MRSLVSQLSIHKLQVFCAVAELGSLSRAAERIGVAQPVVSAHVKALTAKIGAPLLVRSGRKVALTEEGRHVYLWARDMVSRTRELEREMAEFRSGESGRATVGASLTFGSYVLPGLVASFHAAHPKGQISVQVTSPVRVTEAVRAGECDFAFTILDPRQDTAGLQVDPLVRERLVLVASASLLDGRISIDAEDLGAADFVAAQAGTVRREIEDEALARFGVKRERVRMEFGHAEAMKQAVRAGIGIAFLFASSVRDEVAAGTLRVVETPDLDLFAPVYAIRRRGKRLSRFQISLLDELTAKLKERDEREVA